MFRIADDAAISEALGELCEFEPQRPSDPRSAWFCLESGRPFLTVGADGTGGSFALLSTPFAGENSIFFVSSEGQGGFVAAQPEALLGLLIALPYWLDCLKFSGNGQLAEMRRVAPLLERGLLERVPDADHRRRDLTTALGIELPIDPLIQLHAAALGGETIINLRDGSPLESLFNRFTVDSNPLWAQTAR